MSTPGYSTLFNNRYHESDISGSSFLITGGAGFIGSNLVEYLLKYDAKKVRVLDNFSTGSRDNISSYLDNPAFELIEGDIRDIDTCIKACKDMNYVSHQAALGSVPRSILDPVSTNEVNIGGFLNMLTAARDADVKNFVYASSSSVYGSNADVYKKEENTGSLLSPYAVTKYVNELYAGVFSKTYHFHSVGLRYFNVFGPRQRPDGPYAAVIPLFIQAALNNKAAFINGNGENSRDFTFVENAVQANIRAMLTENITKAEAVNIAFGERTTLNQLWQAIAKITGIDLKPIYRAERPGDIKNSLANIEKAAKLFGYKPLFAVSDGLQITIDRFGEFNKD